MNRKITVALAGNPNSGKTTTFNALTGAHQHVGNWPGVTVEKKEGFLRFEGTEFQIVDLPGTYSLTAFSLEEIIARNYVVEGSPDVVVDVVDASNLERNLYLAIQLLEMGANIIVALNMIDVAKGRGININADKLSQLLGVPVVPTNAKREEGVKDLLRTVMDAASSREDGVQPELVQYGTEVEEEVSKIREKLIAEGVENSGLSLRWISVKLLEQDPEIIKKMEHVLTNGDISFQIQESREHLTDIFGDAPEIILTDARYGLISGLLRQCVQVDRIDRVHLSDNIDKVLTNRLLGPIILLLVMYSVYVFTFQGSEPFVVLFEGFFDWLGRTVASVLPQGLLQSLLVSGIIDGVGGVLGFVPLIAFMFFAIAILEDTGYMARVAFMLDRVLRGFGLHGASMLALVVSGGIAGGCAVPGIMATRTMREPKERLVTILVTPLMNCGAKLPVYALLIGAFFPGNKAGMMMLLTFISWGMVLISARIIRSTVLSGPSAPFVLELPPYRAPTLKGLLIHTWERTWMYIKKAGTVILAISVVIWVMMTFPALSPQKAKVFNDRLEKLTDEFLALPEAKSTFRSAKDVEAFNKFFSRFKEGNSIVLDKKHPGFFALGQALIASEGNGNKSGVKNVCSISKLATQYEEYSNRKQVIEHDRRITHLKNTIGGRLGVLLEYAFQPMHFDWKTNIALVGGFAAKEVVVATMGTAYSLGDVDPEESATLSQRLRNEPDWNKLRAFTLILFVMLYAPCVVTTVTIWRETSSLKWPVFALVYATSLAYIVALVVSVVGSALGLGVT
jgi:ferrous iron transport protein B